MLTRLAPSPTGALHLGNARTFLVNWLLARQHGWRILLRIEDLDGPRIKPGSTQQAIEDLQWLGLDWALGPIFQSGQLPIYATAVEKLLRVGLAYPCICTRREVESAASAPHAEDGSAIYQGTCRGRFASVQEAANFAGRPPAIRFAVPDEVIEWTDQFAGPQRCDAARQLGDFVIAKADGTPAYQLAVVVDDMASNVTHIVRGDDLLDSTPRQMLLYRALAAAHGLEDRITAAGALMDDYPRYFHLPLVVGPDGYRLAKRHGDSRLSFYRQRGVPVSRVLQLLARWCGINDAGHAPSASSLLNRFNLATMSRERIVFSRDDDAGLLRSAV
jgi:glutamyl-tRNA synthetase